MKKIIIIIAAVVVSLTASAQIKVGFRCGMNVSERNGGEKFWDNLTNSSLTGFYLGPTLKFVPLGLIGVDVSALYEQRETAISGVTLKQHSFAVPVNLRLQVFNIYPVTLTAFAGPQFGFNLSNDTNKELLKQVGEWKWKQSNLSGNLGVAAMIFKHLEVNANYNFAFGNTGEFSNNALKEAKATIKGRKLGGWRIGVAYYF